MRTLIAGGRSGALVDGAVRVTSIRIRVARYPLVNCRVLCGWHKLLAIVEVLAVSPAILTGPPGPVFCRRIPAVVATVQVDGGQLEPWRSLLMRSAGRCQPSVFRGRSLISAATSTSRSGL